MPDLRTFLAEAGAAVWRIERPLSVVEEITALQKVAEKAGRRPVLFVRQPIRADGSPFEMPVVANLLAGRLCAAGELAVPPARRIESTVVAMSDAPVQEVVRRGRRADLGRLPVLRHHAGEAAHVVCAHVVTCDPETGIDNTAIQHCTIRGPRLLTSRMDRGSHNGRNAERWWARGQDCPCAIWIGHHPAVIIGAHARLGYPESHWGVAGALAGAPVRLVAALTHRHRLKIPADAEIIVEGRIARGCGARDLADGQPAEASIEVDALTMRRLPLYTHCDAAPRDPSGVSEGTLTLARALLAAADTRAWPVS